MDPLPGEYCSDQWRITLGGGKSTQSKFQTSWKGNPLLLWEKWMAHFSSLIFFKVCGKTKSGHMSCWSILTMYNYDILKLFLVCQTCPASLSHFRPCHRLIRLRLGVEPFTNGKQKFTCGTILRFFTCPALMGPK